MSMIPVNVAHLAIAPLTYDGATATTYGTQINLAPMTEATGSPSISNTPAYGDGVKQIIVQKAGEETVKVGINYNDPATEEALYGATYNASSGTVTYSEKDSAPYNAVFWTVEHADGSAHYVMYTKVKFSRPEESVSQSEDSVKFSMPTVEGMAVSIAKGYVVKRVKHIAATKYNGSQIPDYLTAFGY